MKISHAGTEIHAVLDELAAAHAAHDADGLFALYTVDGTRAWFATFDGPVRLTFRDPVVSQDGDLAWARTFTHMLVTPAGQAESISVWYRSTFGLRRVDGSWRIAHRHDSTPFYMDGSFRAATDLEP
jgi:ketosteroid isomerase-like protein